jgi:hypothetical protein
MAKKKFVQRLPTILPGWTRRPAAKFHQNVLSPPVLQWRKLLLEPSLDPKLSSMATADS